MSNLTKTQKAFYINRALKAKGVKVSKKELEPKIDQKEGLEANKKKIFKEYNVEYETPDTMPDASKTKDINDHWLL